MEQQKIGAFLASRRKECSLTQMQFAEKLGVTNKAVSKWETGKCLPDAALFEDICLTLNISLNEFFAGERIRPECVEEKAEENLIHMAKDYQKREDGVEISTAVALLAALIALAANLNVGEWRMEGSPVAANFIVSLFAAVSWGAYTYFTRERETLQKISLAVSAILLFFSGAALLLTLFGVTDQITGWAGLPVDCLFYGFRMLGGRTAPYVAAAVLSLSILLYSRKNCR